MLDQFSHLRYKFKWQWSTLSSTMTANTLARNFSEIVSSFRFQRSARHLKTNGAVGSPCPGTLVIKNLCLLAALCLCLL